MTFRRLWRVARALIVGLGSPYGHERAVPPCLHAPCINRGQHLDLVNASGTVEAVPSASMSARPCPGELRVFVVSTNHNCWARPIAQSSGIFAARVN